MEEIIIDLDEVPELKEKFVLGDILFENENKKFHEIKYDNKTMYIVFKGSVFKWDSDLKTKLFIQVEDELYNLLGFLIYKLKYDLHLNLINDDFLYSKNNKFLVTRVPGFYKNNEYIIFSKFYDFDNSNRIPYNEIPKKFNGIFTIKLKSICKNNYNNKEKITLNTELHEIFIINDIQDSKNIPLSINIVNSKYKKL